jgi:response regulator RpfG family c-di-GMP phosphodiesterase
MERGSHSFIKRPFNGRERMTETVKENILIVDDEAVVRQALSRTLARDSYRCAEAADADEAFEKMEASPFDLAMLDIKMPGKSGLEILPEVKTRYPNTAVIMVTAVTDIEVVTQCMKAGAVDYIPKPFNIDEVSLCVKQSLEKRKFEIELKNHLQGLESQVVMQDKKMRALFLGAIQSLASALEAKDKYTAGHSQRVADLAIEIGRKLAMTPEELDDLRCAALLHDIGKIAVDSTIQNKPGKLNSQEYEHIMRHTQIGPDIVKPLVNKSIVEMIRHHHDWYDGRGLDRKYSGESIPLGARIIAVADTIDAMTSDRPYRKGMPRGQALEEIRRCSGSQFDPEVANALLELSSAPCELV